MSPEIARLYAHVLPVFWPYLWLQLRWIFKRQDGELRTLLISVSKWGHVYIVQAGDHGRAYRKPAAVKPSWDDPVWESHIAPNLADVFQKEVSTLGLPRVRGFEGSEIALRFPPEGPAGAEGGAPYPDTS
ncbi:hypothetical protein BBF93_11340 [Hyphomonas sp. CACIAM 19H1]|uniref:hypothetical protein n=1 Tax=Hyphomonas sp. CACIAM 19H1 TaxID=1873716 RepID=UPI000DED5BF7|nr:hypothetical protein [Hyphomonas sp. CACIAM 19H1]AXE64752.1 hypothetical protein BBF93_11340 [Hyphomonas sp. CACIAM 19H1]